MSEREEEIVEVMAKALRGRTLTGDPFSFVNRSGDLQEFNWMARAAAETAYDAAVETGRVYILSEEEYDAIYSVGDEPMIVGRTTDWEYLHYIIDDLKDRNEKLKEKDDQETITIPMPLVRPVAGPLDRPEYIQEVWDAFVKPDQESGNAQSAEMRMLMAILRAVYKGLEERDE